MQIGLTIIRINCITIAARVAVAGGHAEPIQVEEVVDHRQVVHGPVLVVVVHRSRVKGVLHERQQCCRPVAHVGIKSRMKKARLTCVVWCTTLPCTQMSFPDRVSAKWGECASSQCARTPPVSRVAAGLYVHVRRSGNVIVLSTSTLPLGVNVSLSPPPPK
jgi:hypothetical protein